LALSGHRSYVTAITFSPDGNLRGSAIGSDGRYSVRGVARGKARVKVESHPRVPEGLGGAGPGEKAVEIPSRYKDEVSSGLTVEVSGAKQTHDIDLSP